MEKSGNVWRARSVSKKNKLGIFCLALPPSQSQIPNVLKYPFSCGVGATRYGETKERRVKLNVLVGLVRRGKCTSSVKKRPGCRPWTSGFTFWVKVSERKAQVVRSICFDLAQEFENAFARKDRNGKSGGEAHEARDPLVFAW